MKLLEYKSYYVYVYLDTRKPGIYTYDEYTFDFEPFYIGKGLKERLYDHLYSKGKFISRVINKIREVGLEPIIKKVLDNLTEEKALSIENNLILTIGRRDKHTGPLVNLTDGGEGMSGIIFSDESRMRMGSSNRGKKIPQERIEKLRLALFGRKHTEEHKNAISKSLIGNQNTPKGYICKREDIEKRASSNRGKSKPQSFIDKMKGNTFTLGYKHSSDSVHNMMVGLSNSFMERLINYYGVGIITSSNYNELAYKYKQDNSLRKIVSTDYIKRSYENDDLDAIISSRERATTIHGSGVELQAIGSSK